VYQNMDVYVRQRIQEIDLQTFNGSIRLYEVSCCKQPELELVTDELERDSSRGSEYH